MNRRPEEPSRHTCHWPGCDKAVPRAMWGCGPHWFTLPQEHRTTILEHYQPGQEAGGRPSAKYLDAAHAAQAWIQQHLDRREAAARAKAKAR